MSEPLAQRYKLLGRIAIGGTAEVFRALYVTADGQERPVVIKRILPQFARDERFRRLFHEEACVAVTMSHPSIVRVLDHGDMGPTCYITLELVEGKDLGSLLGAATRTGQTPSPRLAAYVAAQIAEALEFIHAQTSSEGTPLHIIHRDVSPQNILVSYSGDVKLTDFGIAKSAIRREQTVDGTLRGKLDYMSPEQARLEAVDHRADIFGLGCVLYEMLHGIPPFRGENELDTLERVREGRIAVPTAELDAPQKLRDALARALAPSLSDRYQRAAELAADLRAYLTEAGSPSPENLGRWVRELESVPEPRAQSRVDEAVRRLLGDDGGDLTDPGTTVFASRTTAAAPSVETAPGASRRRAAPLLPILFGALLLLGLSGWLLWALSPGHAGSSVDAGRRIDARVVASRAADGGHAPRRLADASARTFLVRSQPPGASVTVDDDAIGWTPIAVPLPAAAFVLELQKEGYRPWRRRLEPASLGELLQVPLAPLEPASGQATITINTLPWSRVRLDGKVVGNTPLVHFSIRAGNHRLELLGPDGSLRKAMTINLKPGTARSFTFDFTR